jgi:CHAT domain-containing protein
LISESKARGRQLDLLVLSACETALGDDNASLGLAGAAVQSGARGAIASLWEINDFYTRRLMVDFYAQYRLGKSKAEALRFAERDVMSRKRNDPNLWASLILVGGWR